MIALFRNNRMGKLTTIILIIIALNIGAYVGKERMTDFNTAGIRMTKDTISWVKEKWSKRND